MAGRGHIGATLLVGIAVFGVLGLGEAQAHSRGAGPAKAAIVAVADDGGAATIEAPPDAYTPVVAAVTEAPRLVAPFAADAARLIDAPTAPRTPRYLAHLVLLL